MSSIDYIPSSVRYLAPADLQLDCGLRLRSPTIAYQTWGTLNERRDNAIVVCHALTASSDVQSWWPGLYGPGRTLDPDRHYIVCANVLGGCYGSHGPQSLADDGQPWAGRYPELTIADLVRHQHALLDALGITSVELVLGGSMGGFQALHWARLEPARIRRLALIATARRQAPQALAYAELQCAVIEADPEHGTVNGGRRGLALARQLGHLSYRVDSELDARFGRKVQPDGRFAVHSYLQHQGAKLVQRFDPYSYLRLTRAMNRFELTAAELAEIRIPTVVVAVDSDQLYPPAEQAELAALLPEARLYTIHSEHGHDGFLIEGAQLDALLKPWLDGQAPLRCAASRSRQQDRSRLPAVLIGATGRVGREVLRRLDTLPLAARLNLIGVGNSRGALLDVHGLAPAEAADRLQQLASGDAQSAIDALLEQGRPGLLIDCTAHLPTARRYVELLDCGHGVVTPNKLAFADDWPRSAPLYAADDDGGALGFSATVGAGLPILASIRRLKRSGDALSDVRAVLSGTLGTLISAIHDGLAFSTALIDAVEGGLAEPDPRTDLSGLDVARKLLIIARLAGHRLEASQIDIEPLVELGADWRTEALTHDQRFAGLISDAKRSRCRYVYKASLDRGQARVGLSLVEATDPLARARGPTNIALLKSSVQRDPPLVVAGAGAGIGVTASAVLADLAAMVERLQPTTRRRGLVAVPQVA